MAYIKRSALAVIRDKAQHVILWCSHTNKWNEIFMFYAHHLKMEKDKTRIAEAITKNDCNHVSIQMLDWTVDQVKELRLDVHKTFTWSMAFTS